jgi:hypothetical protein
MTAKKHFNLLLQSITIWAGFWLLGLPDYYQQYSMLAMGVGCTVLSVIISLAALRILLLSRAENRMARAFWCSFYYTVVLAILDTAYCGIYLGLGAKYLAQYWYLTVFYITPWLTFLPIAYFLRGKVVA